MQVLMRMDPQHAPTTYVDVLHDEDADEHILSFVSGATSASVVMTEDRLMHVARVINRHLDQLAAKRQAMLVEQRRAERETAPVGGAAR